MGKIQSSYLSILGSVTSLAQLKTQGEILKVSKMTDAEKKAKNYAETSTATVDNDDLTMEELNFIAQGEVEATESALKDNPTYENVVRRREAKEFADETQKIYNEELEMDRRAAQAAENAKIAKQEELRQAQEAWRTGSVSPSIIKKGGLTE